MRSRLDGFKVKVCKKMKLDTYKQIIEYIRSGKGRKKQECLLKLQQKFAGFPPDTFHSIYSQELQRKIKLNIKKHRQPQTVQFYYDKCMSHLENGGEPGIILQIAEEVDFPPVMIARLIIGEYLKSTKFKQSATVPQGQISLLLKDLRLMPNEKLANEIRMCLDNDDDCGPKYDAIKRQVGEDYEQLLKDKLEEANIPFLDEEKLKKLGYDKTPDCKLEVPIAVDGFVVNWIESKASFGDEESHTAYLNDQFWSYTNRFGSGIVIYWFGYIDAIDINRNRGIMMHDKFPDQILTLDLLL